MKASLGAQCQEFSTSCRLSLKLDLQIQRETVLHFFDRLRREYPSLIRMRRQAENTLVLEEGDWDTRPTDSRRWMRLDPAGMRFGFFSPPSAANWRQFGHCVMENAPCHLTLDDLDVDRLEVIYRFDLEYGGNHDQLVAETLLADSPLANLMNSDDSARVIDCQPYIGLALSPSCDLQAHLEIKGRTSTYEVRTSDYESQPLSVYLTVRRYWGFDRNINLVTAFDQLCETADELAIERIAPRVVNPLAQAIALR